MTFCDASEIPDKFFRGMLFTVQAIQVNCGSELMAGFEL